MKFLFIFSLLLPLCSTAQDRVLLREGYLIKGTIDSFTEKSLFIVQETNYERKEIPSIMINKVFINEAEDGLSFKAAQLVFVKPTREVDTLLTIADSSTAGDPNHLLLAGQNVLAGFEKLADITGITLVGGVAYVVIGAANGTENAQIGIIAGVAAVNTGLFIASLNNFIKASKHFIKAVEVRE